MVESESARLLELRRQITGHLRSVCMEWPPEKFREMVNRLAAITLKYEMNDPLSAMNRQAESVRVAGQRQDKSGGNTELRH